MTRSRRFALAAVGLLALILLGAAVWLGFRGTQPSPRLAFGAVLEPLGPLVLHTMEADGSDVQPGYPEARQRANGWTEGSADMETLVFISYDEADLQAGHQVEVIDRPGGEPRLLLDVPIRTALTDLALSPDGRTLLVALAEQNGSGPPHLVSIDVPSGTSSELDLGPDPAPRDLAWSPDGSTVAFVGNGLWTMAGDGTNLQLVATAGAVDQRTPSWSPDGTVLAFIARPALGARHQLFTVSASGDIAMLSSLQGSEDDLAFLPRWAPDGRSIAFESSIFNSQMQAFVATTDGDVQTIDDRTDGTWDPRWTPDGSAIVYSAKIGDEQYQIFRTELDGTPPVPLGPVFAGPISATEWFR
jgi:Tol biopolymer transport system component